MNREHERCDVLIIGDEVESILTAISAARAGAKTILARRSTGRLGGLSVRGGLSYMDITPDYVTGLFAEFLRRVDFIRVALNPDPADQTLRDMLDEANVEIISDVEVSIETDTEGFPLQASLSEVNVATHAPTSILHPTIVIDATPDADVMRGLDVPYVSGLGGLLGADQDFLGVSPVFRITGVSVEDLRGFEAHLRANPDLPEVLARALPYHSEALRAEYITRPTFAPEGMDYLDILNPVIGIVYHIWRHGSPDTYPTADIFIDGGNVSRLADGSLGFNGLVARPSILLPEEDTLPKEESRRLLLDRLIALSQGGPIPEALQAEMRYFERWLREAGGFTNAQVIPPEEMYVRQTVTLLARENMTARKTIEGGVPTERSVGTFSYWLDLRGTMLWKRFPGEDLPKPIFNVGLNVALPLHPRLQNVAFVSRSAGYSPIGQGTGRIVQHNALLGEGLGVAAALAALSQCTLTEIVDEAMPQVQEILKSRRDGKLECSGRPTWTSEQIAASKLLAEDAAIMAALREQVTDFTRL